MKQLRSLILRPDANDENADWPKRTRDTLAELLSGVGAKSASGLQVKFNPHHDHLGRFASGPGSPLMAPDTGANVMGGGSWSVDTFSVQVIENRPAVQAPINNEAQNAAKAQEWYDKLPPSQKKAVDNWCSPDLASDDPGCFYSVRLCQMDKNYGTKEERKAAKLMEKTAATAPVYSGTIYRGMDMSAPFRGDEETPYNDKIKAFLGDVLKTGYMRTDALSSHSMDFSTAIGFANAGPLGNGSKRNGVTLDTAGPWAVLMEVRAKKRAVLLPQTGEREVVLREKTKLKLLEHRRGKKGAIHLIFEEV